MIYGLECQIKGWHRVILNFEATIELLRPVLENSTCEVNYQLQANPSRTMCFYGIPLQLFVWGTSESFGQDHIIHKWSRGTPARTHSISGLKSQLTFLALEVMLKSGMEFILKFTKPLQKYLLTCQANSALMGRFFGTGQQQLWRGSMTLKKILGHFSPSF